MTTDERLERLLTASESLCAAWADALAKFERQATHAEALARIDSRLDNIEDRHNRQSRDLRDHQEWLEQHDRWMSEVQQQVTALNEATARRLDAQDQDLARHQQWLERHEEIMARIDARLDRMAATVDEHNARLDRIEKLVERFIQGQEGNGHKL
jgi:chromosome segregation ATPase